MENRPASRGIAAENGMRTRVRKLAEQHGDTTASKMLGIGRPTLARVVAGLGLRPGTIALVRQRLDYLGTSETGDK